MSAIASQHEGTDRAAQSGRRVPRANRGAWTIALLLVTLALTVAARGDSVLPGDVAVTRQIQRPDSTIVGYLADLGNAAGSATVSIPLSIVLVAALWLRRYPVEAAVVASVTVLRPANTLLKSLFDSPRPTNDLVHVEAPVSGWGFPSGHAMGITLLCGSIIWVALRLLPPGWLRRGIVAGAATFILLTGFGRIYVGAHWPSDVLGGYLWGTIAIVAVATTVERLVAPLPAGETSAGGTADGDPAANSGSS